VRSVDFDVVAIASSARSPIPEVAVKFLPQSKSTANFVEITLITIQKYGRD
jgi:hypothetical protein